MKRRSFSAMQKAENARLKDAGLTKMIPDYAIRYEAPTQWRAETAAQIGDKFEARIVDACGLQFARVFAASADQAERMATVMALAPKLEATLRWIADHGDTGTGRRPAYHDMRAAARDVLKLLGRS